MNRLQIFYFLAVFIFSVSCNRQQANGTVDANSNKTAVEKPEGERSRENQEKDQGAALINRLGQSVDLTESQKEAIMQLASETNFDVTSREEMKTVRQEFRRKVMDEILTEEQRQNLTRKKE